MKVRDVLKLTWLLVSVSSISRTDQVMAETPTLPRSGVSIYDPGIPTREWQWIPRSEYSSDPVDDFVYTTEFDLASNTRVLLEVQRSEISDTAGVLPMPRAAMEQNSGDLTDFALRRYIYFDAQTNVANDGPPLTQDKVCNDTGIWGTAHGNDCVLGVTVQMRSPLFTTQTSSHGTTALKILIDEGSILGAIFFLTWFAGIFVV